jgi:hypothetical protein
MNTRVIIPEPNFRYNFEKCAEYGQLVYLSEEPMRPLDTVAVRSHIQQRLHAIGFNPDHDLVCLVGRVLSVAYSLSVISATHPTVRVLMFDARHDSYCERLWQPGARNASRHSEAADLAG